MSARGKSLALAVATVLAAVSGEARLNVVATTADFGAIAQEIGGGNVAVTVLARPVEDPHFVDARPSFIVKLNRADALIEGGAELEAGWLQPLLQGARNPRLAPGQPGRVICHHGVQLLEIPTTLDRAKGDIHAAGNPHYLLDPANAKTVAAHVADAFCQLDAASCASYRANLKKFTDTLEAKIAAWQKLLEPFQGQRIVAYHNSWPYFAQRFGLRIDLFLEPKPGLPPSPAHLAGVIAQMKQEKARVIFVEPYLNRKTAESVARSTGAVVLDVAHFPGGVKGTEGSYLKLMDYLVTSAAKALSGAGP
jgi:zinc/manganese transport system substrate-binding protein